MHPVVLIPLGELVQPPLVLVYVVQQTQEAPIPAQEKDGNKILLIVSLNSDGFDVVW